MPRSIAVALLCGLLVAACGGSGEAGAKARFLADGDKLCNDFGKRFQQLAKTRIASTPAAISRNASSYRELTRDLTAAFEKLDVPKGDAQASGLIVALRRTTSVARRQKLTAKRILAAADRRDAAAVRRGARAFNRVAGGEQTTAARRLDAAMRAYGFENCGRES